MNFFSKHLVSKGIIENHEEKEVEMIEKVVVDALGKIGQEGKVVVINK